MMFGAKKEAREPPIDRVRAMMRGGMSEKDIVKQLKAEGYSFSEVEKALMEVVKAGAAPLPAGAEFGAPPSPAAPRVSAAPEARMKPAPAELPPSPPPAPEVAYAPPQYTPIYPQYQPSYPEYPAYEEAAPEEELQPEVIMEELIESVAEEKFEKFTADVMRLDDEIEKLRAELNAVKEQAAVKPAPEVPKEIADRLDDFEARLGGLEKAFKQLLPSLTQNIQAISKLVADRKKSQQGAAL